VRNAVAATILAVVLAALIAASRAAAAEPPTLPDQSLLASQRGQLLQLAQAGLEQVETAWWSAELGWYKSTPAASGPQPLPALWYAFPLFEAKAAVALADPSPANVQAVNRFATLAENYWDPTIADGSGAFSWYYGLRGTGNAYFDDNGWWGLAYLDAYRATGNRRWLWDAERALAFLDRFGWDAKGGGGMWWDLDHRHKTSEPLAAGALIAAQLFEYTRNEAYLKMAQKYVAWADAHTRNPRQGNLYGRNATDDTVMDYVEGMMAAAQIHLCVATTKTAYCTRAREIADASLDEFPVLADWAPETDVVYLRALADLYSYDHDARWYAVLYANARRAAANARDAAGYWSRRWDGTWTYPGAIYTQAATVQLFAWTAGAALPGRHVAAKLLPVTLPPPRAR
jgi:uncharacterized protein YyaL (SSP411 family)